MESEDLPDFGPRKKHAEALARELIRDAKIGEAPVSLQKIIEYLQTTRSLSVERVDAGTKISGLLVVCREVDEEHATIGFNVNQPWCRRRFTIAHEIGHLLLGHGCSRSDPSGKHNEREADLFAAELLIPKTLLKKDFPKHPKVGDLSALYRVSSEALTRQLLAARLV